MASTPFLYKMEDARQKIGKTLEAFKKPSAPPSPASRIPVCDTALGGADHSYQVEENRRMNAQADNAYLRDLQAQNGRRQFCVTYLEQLLPQLDTLTSEEEVWAFIQSQFSDYFKTRTTLPPQDRFSWYDVRMSLERQWPVPFNAEAKLQAMMALYHAVFPFHNT
jgi:hypothetical protein